MVVYRVRRFDGKTYVGKTKHSDPNIRFRQHSNDSTLLGQDLRRFGFGAFEFSVLATAKDLNELDDLECWHIDSEDCLAPTGYNLRRGNFHWSRAYLYFSAEQRRDRVLSALGQVQGQAAMLSKRLSEVDRKLLDGHIEDLARNVARINFADTALVIQTVADLKGIARCLFRDRLIKLKRLTIEQRDPSHAPDGRSALR